MRNLYYMIAFGEDYLIQFDCVHRTLLDMPAEIALVTDIDIAFKGVTVYKVDIPEGRQEAFKYRTQVHRIIDFENYDAVCYADTDVIIKRNLFEKYSTSLFVPQEAGVMMDNEHFSELLTNEERIAAARWPAINAGLFIVPKARLPFWSRYEEMTERSYKKRPWIAEQHALNWLYFHEFNNWDMRLFERHDIGWPVKGISGEYAEHYICLKNEEKIRWMKDALPKS